MIKSSMEGSQLTQGMDLGMNLQVGPGIDGRYHQQQGRVHCRPDYREVHRSWHQCKGIWKLKKSATAIETRREVGSKTHRYQLQHE